MKFKIIGFAIAITILAGILASPLSYFGIRDFSNHQERAREAGNTTTVPPLDAAELRGLADMEHTHADHSQSDAMRVAVPNVKLDKFLNTDDVDDDLTKIARQISDADNASQAQTAIEQLYALDPELAEQKLRHLDDFCNPILIDHSPGSVKDRMNRFCDSYIRSTLGGSVGMSVEELIATSALMRIEEDLSAKLESQPEEDKSDLFTRLVLSARVPEEIETLEGLISSSWYQHGQQIWKLGYDVHKERFPEADLVKSQTVALLLYRCMRFGGCRNDQYTTIIYCKLFLSGRCAPSSNLEELLYKTTPPVEFGLAQEIFLQLLSAKGSS